MRGAGFHGRARRSGGMVEKEDEGLRLKSRDSTSIIVCTNLKHWKLCTPSVAQYVHLEGQADIPMQLLNYQNTPTMFVDGLRNVSWL
jgi:hypothetical protein